jgi:hypothetical protein
VSDENEVLGKNTYEGSSLNSIVHPVCAIFAFVQRDRCCLPSGYVHSFYDGDFELVGVLSQSCSA